MRVSREQAQFLANYDIVTQHHLNRGDKLFLGDKAHRRCRYCSRSAPDASFRSEAHAFPEVIGNNMLFTYYECDECNSWFGESLDDSLGKYLLPVRSILRIPGKTGPPSWKSKDKSSRIDPSPTGIQLTTRAEHPVVHELEGNKISLAVTAQPYRPSWVYKAFVKMAIAIAPDDEMKELGDTATWVISRDSTTEPFHFSPLLLLHAMTPGPVPYRGVHALLLRRQRSDAPVPHMIFVIAFENFQYQATVPCPAADESTLGQSIGLSFFPVPFDTDEWPYGGTSYRTIDCSAEEVVTDDVFRVTMAYDHKEER